MDALPWVDRNWAFLSRLTRLHVALYRTTRGLLGHHLPGLPSMLLLHHRGARSGIRRITPLIYVMDSDNLIVVASKSGHPRHPAWFHNLLAHPVTVVQVGARRHAVRARVADPQERERLWPVAAASFRHFETYRHRAGREIPVVVLEPHGRPE
ncbi:nitroreductase family deazaflavin-dependent oxidoreductase [Streptomyces sp. NPDC094143]|uniref:nitroreductase family deazaflavin-dependent oxidoreductase n=1 Tax=Streptomyces sp. NPDC094143 TaxID=3155310 RepID=UPI0033177088